MVSGYGRVVSRGQAAAIFTAILCALSLSAGPAQAQTGTGEATTERAAALSVSVAPPEQQDWPVKVPATGWLEPWQEAVISAEVGGQRIDSLNVDVGDEVTKGQVLATFATDQLETTIRQQKAALESAQAALDKASADLLRAQRLVDSGAVSQTQISDYGTTRQEAQATFDQAEAALAASQLDLSHTKVLAVDDGTISSRSAALGAVVTTGTEMFRLIRQNRIEWQAEVPLRGLRGIGPGTKVSIPTPFGEVEGKVRLVGPTVSQENGRVLVYVALPEEDRRLPIRPRPGILVSGFLVTGETPALTVPATAVTLRDGFAYVYTLNAGDTPTVTRRRVETGRRQDDRIEITSGLEADQQVVQSGGAFLADGSVVRVVPAPAPVPDTAAASPAPATTEASK